MQIRVRHHIDRLADDYEQVAINAPIGMRKIVADNIDYGRDLAKALARANAGPHGAAYYKRIHSEMTGVLTGEFGPDGSPKTEFVGVGFRSGMNTDLDRAGDQTLIAASADVRKLLTRLFS